MRTTDGRYASIIYTADADCQGGGAATQPPAGAGGGGAWETVCGVETGGKTYRYRCNLRDEGCQGGGACRTSVTCRTTSRRSPGARTTQIEVSPSGRQPDAVDAASFRDGQTRFDYGGNTCFVYRSQDWAVREIANLND